MMLEVTVVPLCIRGPLFWSVKGRRRVKSYAALKLPSQFDAGADDVFGVAQ